MEVGLTSVYVVNIFGIVLLCVLLVSNLGRLRERNTESNHLLLMMFFTFLGCFVDPFVWFADGQPGALNHVVVVVGNALLYISDMFGTFFWLAFIINHLKFNISLTHRYILHSTLMLGVAIIVVNFFMPLVFDINDQNSYSRQAGYWMYCIMDYGFIMDSIVIYLICRHRGGTLKSFPIGIYLTPLLLGTIAQSLIYGMSLISASFTISIAGLMASLQSERIYKDKLTGVHNYAYLEKLEQSYNSSKKNQVAGIMVNLNCFKKLNKDLGRNIANAALKDAANIISTAIGELGVVVRFTSDEFIAFVNTQDEVAINMSISNIKARFSEFNKDPKNGYKLSACFSTSSLEKDQNVYDFIDTLSKLMHNEKIEFYTQGENNRRRS